MRSPTAAISTLVALFLAAGPVCAGEELSRITVMAGSMRTASDGTVHAEGEVVVQGEGVTVRADTLMFDPGTNVLLLTGGVEMEEDGGGTFTGESLALDLADLTGGIRRGEIIVVPNGFRVRGEDIRRLGPEEFTVRKGVFTSCPGECPDWSFTAREIQVRKEGYLAAKHAAFRIVGIPVFYTPYLYYPVKTRRQTGLLLPEIRVSDETGLESAWPLFITLGSAADVTLTPRTFSRDSLGLGAEARYLLDWGGGGEWNGFTVGGEEADRWYFGGDHAISLAEGVWFRARWYDAGDPLAPALFGRSFDERYPGAVYRHATLEAGSGVLGLEAATDSLLVDGARSRTGGIGDRVDRNRLGIRLGPADAGPLRAGFTGEIVRFDDGMERDLITPSVRLGLPNPRGMSGSVSGEAILSTGGDGTVEDEAYLATLKERISLASGGKWGRHRIDLDVAVSAVKGAVFGSGPVRDGRDLVEDRRLQSAAMRSRLASGKIGWDLEVGGWRDGELDLARGYGMTSLSFGEFFAKGSVNRDAQWGLALPSIDVREAVSKGWSADAGYESDMVGISLGRESTDGSPDLASGRLKVPFLGTRLSGEAFYDLDARTMADETLSVEIPGRCWSLTLSRLRNPGRTDWKLSFDLGI